MGDLVIHEVHKPAHIQKKLIKILRSQGIITTAHPMQSEEANEEENN